MGIGHLDKIQNDEINNEIRFKSSEVREGQILFDLEKKVKIINSLSELISKVENGHVSFKAISDFLNDRYKEEPETYKKLLEYYALVREYQQLAERLKLDLVNLEPRELREKVKSIIEKLNVFRLDEDLELFFVLSKGAEVLKNKYDLIKRMGEDDEIVKDFLEKTLFPKEKNKLERNRIKNIKISAFGIDVIVEKDYEKILYNWDEDEDKDNKKETINLKAFHLTGSPFSIYKEGEKNIKKIRKHESVHNILEGFFPPLVAYPSSLIENKFSLLDEQGGSEKIKQAILSFSPSRCVDLLHEEMFASIEIIEDLLSDPPNPPTNSEHRKGFGTAGNEIYLITNFLKERAKEESDEEIKIFCAEFSKKINEKFDKAVSIMRRVLFIGNKLGMEFTTHSLLTMMKPTKFHHIETYLKSQCGKEQYGECVSIYGELFEKTIIPD